MNYTLMPSLEHRALARIAITLWLSDYARHLVSEINFRSPIRFERQKNWPGVTDNVIKLAPKLPLAELLKKELSSFVEKVGWQIFMWQEHNNFLNTCPLSETIIKLCWTPQGTVDMKKTAEILVGNESFDITTRYKLACTHCLENHIYTLWEQLSGSELYGKDMCMIRTHDPGLVAFWSHYIEGEMAQLDYMMKGICGSDNVTPYEYAFRYSVESGNKAATRYFLQKLTLEEKERILVTTARVAALRNHFVVKYAAHFDAESYTDILCFLLSTMDKEQQTEVFKSSPYKVFKRCSYKVLKCFLDWPWQSFFMETAKRMWTFLPEDDYLRLLAAIIRKFTLKCKDYNYQELFVEFWQQSPATHKGYVIENEEWCFEHPLESLFCIRDEKNIKFILKDATHIQKMNLILYGRGQDICQNLIEDDDWHSLQFFIQECISSKNEMIKLKEVFKKLIMSQRFVLGKDQRDKLFQLLDDFIENSDETKITDDPPEDL